MICLVCLSLVLGASIWGLIHFLSTWTFGYWKRRGIQEAETVPFYGSFSSTFKQQRHMAEVIEDIYRKFKDTDNFVGVFSAMKPKLLILNPELAHKIYVNDFKSFHDNEISDFISEKSDVIFANNPFAMKGDKWKELRNDITPGLTANRIKNAYPVTLEVCEKLKNYIDQKRPRPDGIDMYDLTLRFTCEVSTDCVLGIKAKSLSLEPSEILTKANEIFKQTFHRIIYQLVVGLFPGLEKWYKMRFFPKPVEKFFTEVMAQAIELRKQHKNDRVDFLNYLLQLQEKKHFSIQEMTAHTMTFLVDGFFTTAMTVSHCLFLLARNPETQKKLRAEIMANLGSNGSLDFEKLHEMLYLDACFHETLRVLSPIVMANKICTLPYELENKNGQKLQIQPGEVVIIPQYSFHLDEKYYENPKDFIPERFIGEDNLKSYRDKGLFYGFGNGPRVCLGMRFGLTQGKAAIVEIIKNYQVSVNPKTRSDIRLDPKQFLGMIEGGIFLDLEPQI